MKKLITIILMFPMLLLAQMVPSAIPGALQKTSKNKDVPLNSILDVKVIKSNGFYTFELLSDTIINYDVEEYWDPYSLSLRIKDAEWRKGRYVKNLDAAPLYRYKITENVNKHDPYLSDVQLFFKNKIQYTITQEDSVLKITWPESISAENIFAELPSKLDEEISIKFTDALVLDVVRLIGTKAKLNLVITATSEARTTLDIKDVKISDALDYIIGPSKIKWFYTDDILVITDAESVQGLLKSKVFSLNYSDGSQLMKYIRPSLSQNGQVIPIISSSAPNSSGTVADRLLVIDTGQSLRRVAQVIQELDKREKQINIAVKFIETSLKNTERLGINWQMRTTMAFPSSSDSSSGMIGVGKLTENYNVTQLQVPVVSAVLEALETDADAKILQEPQVTTFNNVEASVTIGTTIPVLVPQGEGSVFGTNPYTYEDQNIDISLSIIPRVNEDGYISIRLNTAVSAIVGYVGPEGDRPITSNRTVNTNVMVRDGETLLIGGLIFENDSRSRSQVPILGKIPILNLLFKSKIDDVEQRELLIFITPSVVG